jgi:hypothetical protein
MAGINAKQGKRSSRDKNHWLAKAAMGTWKAAKERIAARIKNMKIKFNDRKLARIAAGKPQRGDARRLRRSNLH